MGCNGGFPTGAWRFFKMHGLTTEAKYPYGKSAGAVLEHTYVPSPAHICTFTTMKPLAVRTFPEVGGRACVVPCGRCPLSSYYTVVGSPLRRPLQGLTDAIDARLKSVPSDAHLCCPGAAFPPCEHHINSTHYKPCGPSKPTPKCNRAAEKGPRYHGKSVYSVPAKDIQKEIMLYGPVEGAFTVYQDFLTYKTGVYQHTTGPELGGLAPTLRYVLDTMYT